MEKASKNQAVIDAIGEPIKKGPWYNASLAVTHHRHSVSCTFPVSGPQDPGWFPFLGPRDWEILIMDARFHVPGNEGQQQTLKINLLDPFSPSDCKACTDCKTQVS
ncbi:hypothetical protein CISIN_1g033476mg [Citrus sinensis]|uniref:Uncharacterized protein n=1 Tax=Citrus sinensis TaxID=2711 RepID=A0A067EYY1_CITSI|nr:hypothetical protein CISIN_1g033476mg [Citrus sinensis]